MKNFIFILLATFAIGCGKPSQKTAENYRKSHITYQNHSYIVFERFTGNLAYAGVVHHPECQCKK